MPVRPRGAISGLVRVGRSPLASDARFVHQMRTIPPANLRSQYVVIKMRPACRWTMCRTTCLASRTCPVTLRASIFSSSSRPSGRHATSRGRPRPSIVTSSRSLSWPSPHPHLDENLQAQVTTEVRLVTAVLDGIGLQWLLDPTTDVAAATSAYITRTIATWQQPAQ